MKLIPLFVILPLAAAFLISLLGKQKRFFCDIASASITFILFVISLATIFNINSQILPMIYKVGGWLPPMGLPLVVDNLTAFMLLIVNFIAFIVSLYSINYMEKFTAKLKFYTLFLLMLGGMNGVLISGDIFNLYVFFELASIASYALVAYGNKAEELEAAFKYMAMGAVGSLFILLGIAFLYSNASTLNMADLSQVLSAQGTNKAVTFVGILFILGFGIKTAIVPFHAWLADAYPAAPAPISAMLAGVVTKSLGIYSIVRIFFNIFGVNPSFLNLLMFLGALSIIVGGLLALGQTDTKRMFAYSSISQVGYIILGLGIGTPLGILGALFHLFNHSMFKSLLFLNSGAIEYATGTRNLEKLGGLREKMPVTANTSLIASMAVSGIPPFNGFFSKLLIIFACIKSNHIGYGIWAIVGSVLTISYFMKFQKNAFFGPLPKELKDAKEVPFLMQASMIILSIVCLLGGMVMLPKISNYFTEPAKTVLVQGKDYSNLIFKVLNEK
ncbi:MAG: NADH-quinone oxidoreductase subunit M [Candidatus Omnitrophota bacterium]